MKIRIALAIGFVLAAVGQGQTPYDFTQLDRLATEAQSRIRGGFAIILTQNGRTIFEKTYGPFNANQAIAIASASKWLSGALVMSVVDEGRTSLDDRLSKFLPYFTGDKAAITLRQAFSHTAGFPAESAFTTETPCINDRSTTLDLCAQQIAAVPLVAVPGTQLNYGGLSMQAAGRMIEVAAGTSWVQAFADRITRPLGMNQTLAALPGRDQNPLVPGGYASTGLDYTRFLQMILNRGVYDGRRILSPQAVEEMATDQTRGAMIASSPYQPFDRFFPGVGETRYGVGGWLTPNPATPSVEMSSQGAFGFSPWVDFERNLTGVLAVLDQLGNVQPLWVDIRNEVARVVPPARLTYRGVGNAASFRTGALAPGEVIVLFGQQLGPANLVTPSSGFPAELAGTRVWINGQAAPLLYTSASQVSAVVPLSLEGAVSCTLEVEYQGTRTGAITMPVERAAPALFSADRTGRGLAAGFNQDGTLHSAANPARRGEIVVLYGTGGGVHELPLADGQAVAGAVRLAAPVQATIGGLPAEVIYAGSAPGLVAGAVQWNIRVPQELPPGEHPVVVSVGGVRSPDLMRLAVQ